ncbi:MAG: hypothetical protein BIFFINMI_00297 [Phycisphaerae bacterium]|nr:hypothetical protein [Phycisphaerae bacterium]
MQVHHRIHWMAAAWLFAVPAVVRAEAGACCPASPEPTTQPAATTQPATTQPDPATTQPTDPLEVIYFFSPTCLKCKEASKTVETVAGRFGDRIRVKHLNVEDVEALEAVMLLEEKHKVKSAAPPRIFVGETCLTGLDAIAKELEATVERELKRAEPPAPPPPAPPGPVSSPAGGT